jgi:serine/threonine protein phosphatase 1
MATLPEASAPEGVRLYAIGDVHGHARMLAEMHMRIARDLQARPADDLRVIHVGDYIDRGPDSARCLSLAMDYARGGHADYLMGNHEEFMLDFLRNPEGADLDLWMMNGGDETLRSFGVDSSQLLGYPDAAARREMRDAMLEALPGVDAFLEGLATMVRHGDYAFVHAGVRPGVPLERQSAHDLVWIRHEFLSSDADHGAVIVHGHTPVRTVDIHPNRIGIDTGAAYGGPLSCIVLEGREQALLGWDGPEPLQG